MSGIQGCRGAGIVAGLLLFAALATLPLGSGAQASSSTASFVVGFYDMPEERDTYQGEPVTDASRALSFLVVETDEPDRFRDDARQDDRVRYLEPDERVAELALTPDDPRYEDQYGPQITEAESAWDATTGSTAIVVGVVDSGIRASHEDLEPSRLANGYDYVNDDDTPEDDAACGYHGTHVAGIASATIDNGAGIAGVSQHTVTMQKIFDEDGSGECTSASVSQIAQALEDLGDQGAHLSSNSWTIPQPSTTLNEAIDHAHAKGTIHVGAAGNDGPCTDCVDHPWTDRPAKTIVVSCTDSDDGFCSFSSQGSEVDVAAPGQGVLSLDGSSDAEYTKKSGTSMSTPHVSGAAGLYLDQQGDASFATVEDEIVASGDDVGLSAEQQGGGRLDVGELVTGQTSNEAPTASFTASCEDLDCTFDASDSVDPDGSIASYDWDFGDGTSASGEHVDHTYAESGDYTVTLTATDDDGASDEASDTVSVDDNGPPTASFAADCHELNCTLDASASGDEDGTIVDYEWSFGDGTSATGEVVDHGYDEAGDYTVTLTVTDDDGASDQGSQTVSVAPNQPPTASILAHCQELSCSFDGSASEDEDGSVASYEWRFGDGTTASGSRLDHSYDAGGNYTVTLTVTDDDGASDEATETVSVTDPPTTMHVHAIDHQPRGLDVDAIVEVYDDKADPVHGALVQIETCNAEGLCQTSKDQTDPGGEATARWDHGVGGPFTTCVTRLDHGALDHEPSRDHAADGECASDTVVPFGLTD